MVVLFTILYIIFGNFFLNWPGHRHDFAGRLIGCSRSRMIIRKRKLKKSMQTPGMRSDLSFLQKDPAV